MKTVYRVLAYLVCVLVAVQASSHAWASAGLGLWIEQGGVLDKGTFESEPAFGERVGLVVHGINGLMVIPVVALLLLLVSFFAKVSKGVLFALAVVLVVALQVTLGLLGHSMTLFALFHGLNALVLFAVAFVTGRRASKVPAQSQASTADAAVSV